MMFPRGFTLVERRTLKRHLTCSYVESLILWRNVDTVQFAPDLRLICAWLRPAPSGVFLLRGVQFAPVAAQGTSPHTAGARYPSTPGMGLQAIESHSEGCFPLAWATYRLAVNPRLRASPASPSD